MLSEKFKEHWKAYLVQALLAGLSMLVVAFILRTSDIVLVASLGSTVVVIFSNPSRQIAKPENVLGGHFLALLVGGTFYHLSALAPGPLCYGLSVACTYFLMVMASADHPPAAGTALGIAVNGISWQIGFSVMLGAIVLCGVRHMLRSYLRDLR